MVDCLALFDIGEVILESRATALFFKRGNERDGTCCSNCKSQADNNDNHVLKLRCK